MQTTTHHIHRIAVAFALAFALFTAPAAASAQSSAVPPSEHNARWPREPASGPSPSVTPITRPADGQDWTLVSVTGGLLILAACTAAATGVRVRSRQRVSA
jgi:hypothetical protein